MRSPSINSLNARGNPGGRRYCCSHVTDEQTEVNSDTSHKARKRQGWHWASKSLGNLVSESGANPWGHRKPWGLRAEQTVGIL